MATGDDDNMLMRLRALMPRGWVPDDAPVTDGVLTGFAYVAARVHAFLAYVKRQGRIATASDGWLDLLAYDFFGLLFRRRADEPDDDFRVRIVDEILRPRATRQSIEDAIASVTGKPAYLVFEPSNPTDTGGYGAGGRMGYSMAGRLGSLALPYQMFVIPLRPPGQGIPNVMGYYEGEGSAIGGYEEGAIKYATPADITGPVTDADIMAAIESVRPAGTVVWVAIQSTPPEYFLDDTFILDGATLA